MRLHLCIYFALFFCTTIHSISYETIYDITQHEYNITPEQLSNYVFRRYYFIKRLTPTMAVFLDIQRKIQLQEFDSKLIESFFSFNHETLFTNNRVRRSIRTIKEQRSLKPLFMIWDDFIRYKSIKDQVFIEEFTKEIFIISRQIVLNICNSDDTYVNQVTRTIISATSDTLFDAIDYITAKLNELINNTNHTQTFSSYRNTDLHASAHIDDIVQRFYIRKRLLFAIEQLHNVKHFYRIGFRSSIHLVNYPFSHAAVLATKQIMEQTGSLVQLFELWHDIDHFKHIQDTQFIHEVAVLIFLTYKAILENTQPRHKANVDSLIALYHKIDSLPLEGILDAIDLLAHELPEAIEKYELNNAELTWSDWLKKYWWVPPLVLTTLGIKVFLKLRI